MRKPNVASLVWWSLPAWLSFAACGTGQDDLDRNDQPIADIESAETFDESRLPGDFPRELIPPSYESGNYMQLGPVATASFESRASSEELIAHYTGLLGEPRLDNTSADRERTTQWDAAPWTLSVVGGNDGSIIGLSKVVE